MGSKSIPLVRLFRVGCHRHGSMLSETSNIRWTIFGTVVVAVVVIVVAVVVVGQAIPRFLSITPHPTKWAERNHAYFFVTL